MPPMTKKEFAEQTAQYIRFGLPEDENHYVVQVSDIIKQNDANYTGIIIGATGNPAAPTIYIEAYYEEYLSGRATPLSTAGDIIDMYEEMRREIERINRNTGENIDIIMNYDTAKEYMRFRVVEIARNQEWLADKPYVPIGNGLAEVFYMEFSGQGENGGVFHVTDQLLHEWSCDLKQMEKDAVDNQCKENPAVFERLAKVISEMSGMPVDVLPDPGLYRLTNREQYWGAGCLYYPGVQEQIAEMVRGDYYVIPSSVHEHLILPVADAEDALILPQMVKEINQEHVMPKDVLSDNVLFYNHIDKILSSPFSPVPAQPQIPIGKASRNMQNLLRLTNTIDSSGYPVTEGTFQYGELEQLKLESQILGVDQYFDFESPGCDVRLKSGLLEQFDFVGKEQEYDRSKEPQKNPEHKKDGPVM